MDLQIHIPTNATADEILTELSGHFRREGEMWERRANAALKAADQKKYATLAALQIDNANFLDLIQPR